MPTITQLSQKFKFKKNLREPKENTLTRSRRLLGCPHRRGICKRVVIVKPKKPNSAKRKVARVNFSDKRRPGRIMAYVPGIGHNLRDYSEVFIRGGHVPDLPGIQYHLVRGKLDFNGPESFERINRRSIYGMKQKAKKEMIIENKFLDHKPFVLSRRELAVNLQIKMWENYGGTISSIDDRLIYLWGQTVNTIDKNNKSLINFKNNFKILSEILGENMNVFNSFVRDELRCSLILKEILVLKKRYKVLIEEIDKLKPFLNMVPSEITDTLESSLGVKAVSARQYRRLVDWGGFFLKSLTKLFFKYNLKEKQIPFLIRKKFLEKGNLPLQIQEALSSIGEEDYINNLIKVGLEMIESKKKLYK